MVMIRLVFQSASVSNLYVHMYFSGFFKVQSERKRITLFEFLCETHQHDMVAPGLQGC